MKQFIQDLGVIIANTPAIVAFAANAETGMKMVALAIGIVYTLQRIIYNYLNRKAAKKDGENKQSHIL